MATYQDVHRHDGLHRRKRAYLKYESAENKGLPRTPSFFSSLSVAAADTGPPDCTDLALICSAFLPRPMISADVYFKTLLVFHMSGSSWMGTSVHSLRAGGVSMSEGTCPSGRQYPDSNDMGWSDRPPALVGTCWVTGL